MSAKQILDKFIFIAGSITFLFIILIMIIIACIIGSLMTVENASIYVFNAFWFIGLEFCLCISIICGIIKQWPFKKEKIGFVLIHFSIIIILCGGLIGHLYGKKGYMELVESQISSKVVTEKNSTIKLPFRVKLNDFTLEKHQQIPDQQIAILSHDSEINSSVKFNGTGKISFPDNDLDLEIIQIEPDFMIDENKQAGSRSEYWDNPAVKVKIDGKEGWLLANRGYNGMAIWKDSFIKYICNVKGGQIKDYKSNLSIIKDDKTILNKIIEVNKPLVYEGYKFYQYSFDPENLRWTALQVKTDPGVPVVYAGYVLLIVGIFFNLYFMTTTQTRAD